MGPPAPPLTLHPQPSLLSLKRRYLNFWTSKYTSLGRWAEWAALLENQVFFSVTASQLYSHTPASSSTLLLFRQDVLVLSHRSREKGAELGVHRRCLHTRVTPTVTRQAARRVARLLSWGSQTSPPLPVTLLSPSLPSSPLQYWGLRWDFFELGSP